MKVGKIPVASLIILAYAAAKLLINIVFPGQRIAVQPYLDGGMMGALFVFGLYYLNIYLTAWQRNRSEEPAK